MGKTEEREHCSKIELVLPQKEKKGKKKQKKDPILERGGRVYVLDSMFVTLPTCQVERSPLNALAS